MAFEFLTLTKCKLSSVNVRSEKHGPELVPAVDLKLSVDSSNDILDKFHPDLKQSLFFKAQEEDGTQDELDGIDPVTNLPNLRFSRLEGPLKWNTTGSGYELMIDYGLGGASNLNLYGCEINNFSFSPKEGGTVEVKFRVQISEIEEHLIGKLAMLVEHDVHITLTAPSVTAVAEILDSMESPFINQADLDASDDGALKTEGELFPGVEKTPEQAFAESVGEMADEVGADIPDTKKTRTAKYRHPETADVWSGRGLKPKWVSNWLDEGGTLADLEATDDEAETA